MSYSVGEVAGVAGVTVRTLHHYDEIGLVSPSGRTRAGYRRYDEPDLERLQQVLFYRELGFALDEIAAILADEGDPVAHLRRQHRLLRERVGRLTGMLAAVERAMEAATMGISLTPEERFEVFGDDDPDQYADEAKERWGDTDAYKQSQRRTSTYTKEDWLRIKAEAAEIDRRWVEALRSGEPATGQQAMDVADAHRQHIQQTYYDLGYDAHRGLADMYLADPRFTAHYDDQAPGLARYVHDAIHANADRNA